MITNEPSRWGEYKTARAYYAPDEWLAHRVCLASAKRVGNQEQIAFYTAQVKACERELGLTQTVASNLNTAQQSLFESLLK